MALIVVTGPPAGGKSSWVRQHAETGDIVVDFDLIAGALTAPGGPTHGHPRILRDIAYRARAAAVQEALKHLNKVDVYVIHTMPPADALARYAEHNAQVITIDPGRDIVMQRIAEQRPHTMLAVAERWYATHSHAAQAAQTASRHW